MPRTVTANYHFPPARPTTVPPAHLCTRDDLIDLAIGASQHNDQLMQLQDSPEHISAICHDYSAALLEIATLELELTAAKQRAADWERLYRNEKAMHDQSVTQMTKSLAESIAAVLS